LGLEKVEGRTAETLGKASQRIGALFKNRIRKNPPGFTLRLLKNPFCFCFCFAIILFKGSNISKLAQKKFFKDLQFLAPIGAILIADKPREPYKNNYDETRTSSGLAASGGYHSDGRLWGSRAEVSPR
jgi:hypothetical protein